VSRGYERSQKEESSIECCILFTSNSSSMIPLMTPMMTRYEVIRRDVETALILEGVLHESGETSPRSD